ncbi:class I SAM-dependent methyltransferase [Gammaproteobacteria bacterium]|nr:class I SAM-dependent methyltransferase [Gammaproteobacteria bacterium]|tara:strand:+ start:388 stop:1047 length:660 start_codon:yes stop_codon:yes gene_type:complete
MGIEIDLLKNYPKPNRDVKSRASSKSEKDRSLAREFGEAFFDGDRSHGYGGFNYNPRFWEPVVPTFIEHWNLKSGDSILDVGCAKGFMIFDFYRMIEGLKVSGIDISKYAIENSVKEVQEFVQVASADNLPYADNSFDYAISITTVHNLERDGVIKALRELERVSSKGSFITVDAYTNNEEKERMYAWNLTAKTILHVDEWKELFKEAEYNGDYYWFMP